MRLGDTLRAADALLAVARLPAGQQPHVTAESRGGVLHYPARNLRATCLVINAVGKIQIVE